MIASISPCLRRGSPEGINLGQQPCFDIRVRRDRVHCVSERHGCGVITCNSAGKTCYAQTVTC